MTEAHKITYAKYLLSPGAFSTLATKRNLLADVKGFAPSAVKARSFMVFTKDFKKIAKHI